MEAQETLTFFVIVRVCHPLPHSSFHFGASKLFWGDGSFLEKVYMSPNSKINHGAQTRKVEKLEGVPNKYALYFFKE